MRVGDYVTVCDIRCNGVKSYNWVYEIIQLQHNVAVLRDVANGSNNPFLVIPATHIIRSGQELWCNYHHCRLLAEKER